MFMIAWNATENESEINQAFRMKNKTKGINR